MPLSVKDFALFFDVDRCQVGVVLSSGVKVIANLYELIAIRLIPFWVDTSGVASANPGFFVDCIHELDCFFPDGKVAFLFGEKRVSLKVWYHDLHKIWKTIHVIVCLWILSIVSNLIKQTPSHPVGLDERKYGGIVIAKRNHKLSNTCLSSFLKSKCEGPFAVCETRQPRTEMITIDVRRERRDGRLVSSHGKHLLQGVNRGQSRRAFHRPSARFIVPNPQESPR